MKTLKIFSFLLLILLCQVSFSQPPHPGGDPSTTLPRKPSSDINNQTTPVGTSTLFLLTLASGYAIVQNKRSRRCKNK
jgi:hypothetical protein